MKWFEILREEYDCPVAMLHVPYQGDGEITDSMRNYVVDQLRNKVIPALEEISGKAYDEDRLKEMLARSAQAEDDLVWVLESAKHRPSPIDAYFGGVYYIGPIFTAFRGTEDAVDYYRALREEVEERMRPAGPDHPRRRDGRGALPRRRRGSAELDAASASSGRCSPTRARSSSPRTYTKVGGVYDIGFRHDPTRPLETLADYCMGCYTNLNLPVRVDMLARYIEEYEADGFLINSVKSCNSFSAGQLMILREVENRTGKPGGFIESDLVDPRYFSAANIKNRLESYFQMIEQKRGRGTDESTASASTSARRRPRRSSSTRTSMSRAWHHQQPQQLRGGLRGRAGRGADQRPLRPVAVAARERRAWRRRGRGHAPVFELRFASSSTCGSSRACMRRLGHARRASARQPRRVPGRRDASWTAWRGDARAVRRGRQRKSDFFRDLAGSRYMDLAEGLARDGEAGFDALVGLFDKAILEVENAPERSAPSSDHARRPWRSSTAPRRSSRRRSRRYSRSSLEQQASVGTGYGRARLPFPKDRSARRSSATASARTPCSRTRAPCSTSAARTPRRSRSTSAASSPRSR